MARKARRALFTDSESGKCSTISGSRIATFVPCWSKLAYLPRTAVGLAAVREVSGFFIEVSWGWSSEPGGPHIYRAAEEVLRWAYAGFWWGVGNFFCVGNKLVGRYTCGEGS